jgi:hypothetical protein
MIKRRTEQFSGYNKPKRTPDHKTKSHAVLAKSGDEVKLIRFGQQGVKGSPDGTKRNEAFKARHAENIAKGKMSAAYWANRTKWAIIAFTTNGIFIAYEINSGFSSYV